MVKPVVSPFFFGSLFFVFSVCDFRGVHLIYWCVFHLDGFPDYGLDGVVIGFISSSLDESISVSFVVRQW